MTRLSHYLKPLTGFIVVSLIFGTMYLLIQTQNRLSANDMPGMVANTYASMVSNAASVQTPLGNPIDITSSLAPFFILYDAHGKPVNGTANYKGKLPVIPYGVLTHAGVGKPHAITWQLAPGLRFASVTVKTTNGYYITAAQSLRQTEERSTTLLLLTAIPYLLTVGVCATYYYLRHIRR